MQPPAPVPIPISQQEAQAQLSITVTVKIATPQEPQEPQRPQTQVAQIAFQIPLKVPQQGKVVHPMYLFMPIAQKEIKSSILVHRYH